MIDKIYAWLVVIGLVAVLTAALGIIPVDTVEVVFVVFVSIAGIVDSIDHWKNKKDQ